MAKAKRAGKAKAKASAPKKKTAKASPKKKTAAKAKAGGSKKAAAVIGKSVDGYVRMLPSPQQVIVNRLRSLVVEAAPEAHETIKWSQPVFEANGTPFAHIKAHNKHVNFGFWRGAMLEAPEGTLEGDGDRMRHVKVTALQDIKTDVLRQLVRQAVLLNQRLGDPTR